MAYYRAVCNFFDWLEQHSIGELVDIEPVHVAAYLKTLKASERRKGIVIEREAADPTKKQHLAATRMLFDWLIVGQVLAINPAHTVRSQWQTLVGAAVRERRQGPRDASAPQA
jgi:site-specific recombinase XerD